MRGPFDDMVSTGDETAMSDGRLPGGKPLVRLLQLLEERGLTDTASSAVASAVPAERRDDFDAAVARFTAAPGDQVAEEALVREYFETGNQLAGPPTAGPQWRSLGPVTIPNGQTYGANRVNVSGRIATIVVDPANHDHLLAGAANGGVWESRDRGVGWLPRTDYAATLAVGALAFDPGNPAVVYCGTGEGNWWSFLGAGVLRSADGGTTWSTLCTAPFVGQGFYDLVVNPAATNAILAATTGGLYTSTDSGVTWMRRRAARTWSISMASGEILAACQDGLHRSTDGGATWNAVALPGVPAAFDRLAVAIAPSEPAVAYAWGASKNTAWLWRRAAGAWTAVAAPPGVAVGQAWYDWFLAVSPDRSSQIYCGAIEVHRGDLAGAAWTWRNLTDKDAAGDSIHPDQHAMAFDPVRPDTIYVGNDGGLYRSDDRGITWAHLNNGLVISELEYLAQDLGSSRFIVGGTQDNGTERWRGSSVFDHIADGDGGDCGVNRTDPRTVFHTYYGMSLERSRSRGDWGSWEWIAPPIPAGDGSLFYPPFETSATSGDTIAMGGARLWLSRNNGTTWSSLDFPFATVASAMFIPNSDSVYVGVSRGEVFHTTWTGAAWTALTQLATPRANAFVSDLFVDPGDVNRMWLTSATPGGGRVFRSDDGGAQWTDRTAGLPGLPVHAIEVDPANRNRIWVAADLGVYESRDGGASWSTFANGLPNCFIGDLVFHPHARVLRAGTRNRGLWEIPVDGWMTQPVCGTQWTGSLNGNASGTWFTWGWPATWHVLFTIMPTTPRPGSPQVSWTVRVERANAEYATYWITVTNLTPDPLTFEGRYCLLSRY